MKKLSLLISFLIILAISCTAQKWYPVSYKAYFTDSTKYAKPIRYMGTLLTPTAAEFNLLHGLTATNAELIYVHGVTSAIQTQLNAKQATLVSATNIKTVGGISLLGSGDIPTSGAGTVTSVAVTTANGVSASVANPTSAANLTFILGAITPASVNSVVVSGGSTPRLTVTGTTAVSGTNTGDNAINNLYSGLVTNATHTGDVTGSGALTIANGAVTLAKMANMATASFIYRATAGTGAPEVTSLATVKTALGLTGTNTGDQTSITGNAGTATKWYAPILVNNISVDGSADVTIPSNITATVDGYVMTVASGLWTCAAPASVTISARVDSIVAVLKDTIPLADVAVLKHATITPETSSYVLQLADDGTTITMNVASANTLTVPLNSSVAFPIGTVINIECIGAGKTTVVATGGVTIISKGSYLGITVLGDASLHKLGTNTWKLIGSLE